MANATSVPRARGKEPKDCEHLGDDNDDIGKCEGAELQDKKGSSEKVDCHHHHDHLDQVEGEGKTLLVDQQQIFQEELKYKGKGEHVPVPSE